MDVALTPQEAQVMVKKSALTLFQGEWVVFVPKHHEEEHHNDKAHEHDEDEDEHAKHAHEADEEIPYEAQVVEVIAYAGEEVAIKGIEAGTEYVSNGVYFVKSMLLKSALGEHGH